MRVPPHKKTTTTWSLDDVIHTGEFKGRTVSTLAIRDPRQLQRLATLKKIDLSTAVRKLIDKIDAI